MPTLVEAGKLDEGTLLHFDLKGDREFQAIGAWLEEDPRRGQATWVIDRRKPLLWAYDGRRYSPTGLVTEIWERAGWTDRPTAVQGPERWSVYGGGTLWELAKSIQDAEAAGGEELR
ncbi:MAG: hypothetical protein ABIS86_09535 [Streptosporangiaceae bacterium]